MPRPIAAYPLAPVPEPKKRVGRGGNTKRTPRQSVPSTYPATTSSARKSRLLDALTIDAYAVPQAIAAAELATRVRARHVYAAFRAGIPVPQIARTLEIDVTRVHHLITDHEKKHRLRKK